MPVSLIRNENSRSVLSLPLCSVAVGSILLEIVPGTLVLAAYRGGHLLHGAPISTWWLLRVRLCAQHASTQQSSCARPMWVEAFTHLHSLQLCPQYRETQCSTTLLEFSLTRPLILSPHKWVKGSETSWHWWNLPRTWQRGLLSPSCCLHTHVSPSE